ncbi:MAG: hypothetical protein V1722_05060 [Candidatus Micrarchaeota archaeon]
MKTRGNVGSVLLLSILLLSLAFTVNAADFKQFKAKEFTPQEKASSDFAPNSFKQNGNFKIPDSTEKNRPTTLCPGSLLITSGPTAQILDDATGSIRVNWNTNIDSTSELFVYRYDSTTRTNVVEATIRNTNENTRSHSITVNGLAPGNHFAEVTSKTIATQQCQAKVVSKKVTGGIFVQYPHGAAPQITFEAPTPSNGAEIDNKQITIKISSDKALQTAKIFLVYPNRTQTTATMARLGATSYSYTFKAPVGAIVYSIYALDEEEQVNNTLSYFFKVKPTQLTFIEPTPANSATLGESVTQIIVKINSNRALRNAKLKWTNEKQQTAEYIMNANGQTEFSVNVPNLKHGQHAYFVEAIDTDGDATTTKIGTSTGNARRFLTITSTAPQVTFTAPTPTEVSTTNRAITIKFSSSEPLASAVLRWYTIGNPTTTNEYAMTRDNPTTFSKTFISLNRGAYTYQVIATDNQGDVSTTVHRTLVIAPTLPTINFDIGTPQDQQVTTNRTIVISFDSNEALNAATIEWIYPNQTITITAMTRINATHYAYTQNNLPRGANYYRITATDTEGDTSRSQQKQITINATPPLVSLISPTPVNGLQATERAFTIKINSNEPLTNKTLAWTYLTGVGTYEMQETSANNYEYNIINLQPGTHSYKVYTTDAEGDAATTEERTLNVQATPPQINFVDPTPANALQTTQRDFTIRITSNEQLASINLHLFSGESSVSMQETTVNTYEYNVSMLSRGLHSYYVEVTDTQSDTAMSETRTLEVQQTLPTITFLAPTPEDRATTPERNASVKIQSNEELLDAVISWTDSNDVTTTTPMQRVTGIEYIYTTPNGLPRGQHSYTITATDKEHDITTTPTRTLTILVTSPQITFISPTLEDGATTPDRNASVKIQSNEELLNAVITWTDSNDVITTSTMQRVTGTEYIYITSNNLPRGQHRYAIKATDIEYDITTTPERTLIISVTPPLITFISPTPQDGVIVLPNTLVTIKITSNEPLTSATLNWVDPNGTPIPIPMTRNTDYEFEQTVRTTELGQNAYAITATDTEGDMATTATRTINVAEHQLLADQAQQWDTVNHFEQGGWHYRCLYDDGRNVIASFRGASDPYWYCNFGSGTGYITSAAWIANIPQWSGISAVHHPVYSPWNITMSWTSNYTGTVNVIGWYTRIAISGTGNVWISFKKNGVQFASVQVLNNTNITYSNPINILPGDEISTSFGTSNPASGGYDGNNLQFKMQITS